VAALARNLGHGVSASQGGHDRRAPVRRSGSIHPGNADSHLSGDDGPGDPVAYARLLAYGVRFPGSSKPEVASGLSSMIGASSPSEKSYPENTTTHGLKRYVPGQGRWFFGVAKRPNVLVGFDATMNPRGGAATRRLTAHGRAPRVAGAEMGCAASLQTSDSWDIGLQTGDFTRPALGYGLLNDLGPSSTSN